MLIFFYLSFSRTGIAAGHQISDVESFREGNLVFFDMLGAFVVRWRESFVVTIDLIVIILSVFSVFRNSKWAKRNGKILNRLKLKTV